MTTNINPAICPFCQGTNQCMAQSDKSCWCFAAQIPKELIALVPADKQRQACICQTCVNLFNQDATAFKSKFLSN
ncbi:cysteine-rich CWC family protein [Alteromonadaceae bacterium BrNp21-10]|nr:cysteine-rich CWC family protein [Alteromonadaceae bacterium BrNp21-10]